MGRIYIEIGKNDAVLYKQLGAKPEIVLTWVHREIVKILGETENVYGCLNNLDEETLVSALIDVGVKKKKLRLEQQEKNRLEVLEKEKKKEKLGKIKTKHLENVNV